MVFYLAYFFCYISVSVSLVQQKTTDDRQRKTATPPIEEPSISDDTIRKRVEATVGEYLCTGDVKEAVECIIEIKASKKHDVVMKKIICDAVEKKISECSKIGVLLNALLGGVVSRDAFEAGLHEVLSQSSDIIVDVPHLWNMLAALISPTVAENTITLSDLRKFAEHSLDNKDALGLFMAEILAAVVKSSNEKQALELWTKSGIKWNSLVKNEESLQKILKKTKLEFTVNAASPFPHELFDAAGSNESEIRNWLKANVRSACPPTADIVNHLCTAICKSSIVNGESLLEEVIKKYCKIMVEFITPYDECKKQLLLVAQKIADDLNYPKGLLYCVFNSLYDNEVVEENTIYEWYESSNVSNHKNIAMRDVEPFVEWLRLQPDDQQEKDATNNSNMKM